MLSIRQLHLLTELARPADRIVALRVKLEVALPGWSFIHTHFGLGYRLVPELKHELRQPVHN